MATKANGMFGLIHRRRKSVLSSVFFSWRVGGFARVHCGFCQVFVGFRRISWVLVRSLAAAPASYIECKEIGSLFE